MDVDKDNQHKELSLYQDVDKLHLAANESSHQNTISVQDMDQNINPAASTVLIIHETNPNQNNREEIPPSKAVGTKNLILNQTPSNRQEIKRKMPDRLPSSQSTKPTVHVPKLIQQTIKGGPMSHQSRRLSSRKRRSETNAPFRTQSHNFAQTNLAGQNQAELDTETFGDNFPS